MYINIYVYVCTKPLSGSFLFFFTLNDQPSFNLVKKTNNNNKVGKNK